jgi:hypothetical protein
MEKGCGTSWVKHSPNNTVEVAKLAKDLQWPEATTLTPVALAEASAELINGREDAASIVLVIAEFHADHVIALHRADHKSG